MESTNIKSISRKTVIINIIIFLLLLFLFYKVYSTASVINNEISYKNYLEEQKRIKLNPDLEIEINENEKIKYPLYITILLMITFFLILESSSNLVDNFKEYSRGKHLNSPKN